MGEIRPFEIINWILRGERVKWYGRRLLTFFNSSTPRNYQHVTRQKKTSFSISLPSSKLTISLISISTLRFWLLLILTVCRRYVIWTSWWTSLTMESLWLSGRALECQESKGLRFNSSWWLTIFSFSHAHEKTKKNILLYVTSLSIISMHYPADKCENTQTYPVEVVIVI